MQRALRHSKSPGFGALSTFRSFPWRLPEQCRTGRTISGFTISSNSQYYTFSSLIRADVKWSLSIFLLLLHASSSLPQPRSSFACVHPSSPSAFAWQTRDTQVNAKAVLHHHAPLHVTSTEDVALTQPPLTLGLKPAWA